MFNKNRFDLDIVVEEYTGFKSNKFRALNESSKEKVTDKLLSKLLRKVKSKYNKKYYEPITKTKGEINKLKEYTNVAECLAMLKRLDTSKAPFVKDYVSTIDTTLDLVHRKTKQFKKAYEEDAQLPVMLYENLVASIIDGLLLVCSEFVVFEKNNFGRYETKVKASERNLKKCPAFKLMDKVNDLDRNKKLDKLFGFENSVNESVTLAAGIGAGYLLIMAAIPLVILFLMRTCVYMYYNAKYYIADRLKYIAKVLEMNTSTLGDSDKDKKTKEKQEKIIVELRKLADKFERDNSISETKAKSEEKNDDAEIKDDMNDPNGDDDIIV